MSQTIEISELHLFLKSSEIDRRWPEAVRFVQIAYLIFLIYYIIRIRYQLGYLENSV